MADNATNNDTLVAALEKLLAEKDAVQWNSKNNHFHCFAHILNLVSKAAMNV